MPRDPSVTTPASEALARGALLCVVLSCAILGGCAVRRLQRPDWARFGNTSTAEGGPAYYRDPHHQYFDKAHRRYYYYDPVQKQFFWENGQPKS